PAVPPDVWRRGYGRSETARRRSRTIRDCDPAPERRALRQARFSRRAINRRRFERARAAVQSVDQGAHRKIVPARTEPTTLGRNRRGFRLVDERSRNRLPEKIRNPPRLGNGGECSNNG